MKRCISVTIECPFAVPCDSVNILCWREKQFDMKEPRVMRSEVVWIDPANGDSTAPSTTPEATQGSHAGGGNELGDRF